MGGDHIKSPEEIMLNQKNSQKLVDIKSSHPSKWIAIENYCIKNIMMNDAVDFDEAKYGDYEVPTETELDSSSMTSIYHVTPSDVVDSIFKHEFDREFNNKNGNVYGAGVYTTISVKDSRKLLGSYGDAMIELKVIGGFDRFIIFDALLAKKYYGENYRVLDQLKTMLPTKIAIKLYQDCGTNVKSYSKLANKYNIRGAIYHWNGVTAVLPFDFSSVIPYAVSYDGGKTFNKKLNSDTLKRTLTSVDVEYRYGDKYKKIDKAIAGYNLNGEETGFSRVLKKNGKYNYIDIQDGSEISPIDFDSVTLMNPEDGSFQIEYNGVFFDACLDGFYVGDEGYTFDELPNFA